MSTESDETPDLGTAIHDSSDVSHASEARYRTEQLKLIGVCLTGFTGLGLLALLASL
jgi:hypothetical protein